METYCFKLIFRKTDKKEGKRKKEVLVTFLNSAPACIYCSNFPGPLARRACILNK